VSQPHEPLPDSLLDEVTAVLLAAPEAERGAVCERFAQRHPQHRAALLRLLRRLCGAERLLADSFAPPSRQADPASLAGHRVVRRLGEGAFGTVYLCQQEQPVERLVAIKVIRPGHGEGELLRRFHGERQVLASLSHPAIAQVYDAGCLPDGRPYFVMEFVDGVPITQCVRDRHLEPPRALRLFIDLCHGVEHAHSRGVVHRDLKPGNVLVVDSEPHGQPKIIDFGIAKALQAAREGDGARTETGRVMGTPGYMSPEQAAGRVDEIDARTDVFALGVMLYELLTGDLPWPRGALHETRTDPALPSVRITRNARRAPGSDPASARRQAAAVRGDLDWITLKALRREREERYASARELAEDLERHLAGLPVRAARPTLVYRLRKAFRRHRTAVAALAAAAVIAAAGLGIAFAATRDSSSEVLAVVDGLLLHANDATVHRTPQNEALRRALASDALAVYERHLRARPADPALRARRVRALTTLSDVHAVLGQLRDATRTAEEAAGEAEALLAGHEQDTAMHALFAAAIRMRVKALQLARDFRASLPLCERAVAELELCASVAPADHGIPLAQALRERALAQQLLGDGDAGIASCRRSISVLEGLVAGGTDVSAAKDDLVWARFTLGSQLTDARRFDEAETVLAAAAASLPEVTADRLGVTAAVYCQQGRAAMLRGDVDAAVPRLSRGVAACEAWLAQEPNQVRAQWTLFEAVRQLARAQEAKSDPAATATMARAVELAEARIASFPENSERFHDLRGTAYDFARALWNRFRRSDLALARTWLQRCVELTGAAVAAGGTQRPRGWEAKSVAALVGDSAGDSTDAQWDQVTAELPRQRDLAADEPAQQVVEAWLGVVRSRLRRDQVAGAREALQEAAFYLGGARDLDAKLRGEAAYWRARVALAGNDFAAAETGLQDLLALRPSWWGHWRGGDVAFAAWQALAARGGSDAEIAAWRGRAEQSYRRVAEALAEQVQRDPTDPWPVVPWGLASAGLAAIEAVGGDAASARVRVDAALAALARVQAEAHLDLWDEARVTAGRELARRLANASR
jgi:serine/threonine-protein kinase